MTGHRCPKPPGNTPGEIQDRILPPLWQFCSFAPVRDWDLRMFYCLLFIPAHRCALGVPVEIPRRQGPSRAGVDGSGPSGSAVEACWTLVAQPCPCGVREAPSGRLSGLGLECPVSGVFSGKPASHFFFEEGVWFFAGKKLSKFRRGIPNPPLSPPGVTAEWGCRLPAAAGRIEDFFGFDWDWVGFGSE